VCLGLRCLWVIGAALGTVALAAAGAAAQGAPGEPPPATHGADARVLTLYSFEEGPQGWRALSEGGAGAQCTRAELEGGAVLQVTARFPGTAGAFVKLPEQKRNWQPFGELLLSVYLPSWAPERVQLIVYLKDSELRYYQSLRRAPLRRGVWTRLRLAVQRALQALGRLQQAGCAGARREVHLPAGL